MKNDPANLEGYIRKCIYDYPTLYRSFDYERSRLLVLGHTFLSYGTALEWHPEGFLTYIDYDGKTDDGYMPVETMDELPEGFFEKKLWYVDVLDTRKEEIEADLNGGFFYWNGINHKGSSVCVFESDEKKAKELSVKYIDGDSEAMKYKIEMAKILGKELIDNIHPFPAESFNRDHFGKELSGHLKKLYEKTYMGGYSPYPMSKYSPIVEMVKKKTEGVHINEFDLNNVRPDWAKGAVDISRYCLDFYKNENNHKYIHYYPDGKPNSFYERDPEGYRANCQDHSAGAVFTDEMTIEEYTWASWEYFLAEQIGWFEKLIEMYE